MVLIASRESAASGRTGDTESLEYVKLQVTFQGSASKPVVMVKLSHGTERFESEEEMMDMVVAPNRRVLRDLIAKMCDNYGENNMNPFGYWTWRCLIENNLDMWSLCATELRA